MREKKYVNVLPYAAATVIVIASLGLSTRSFFAIILHKRLAGEQRFNIEYYNARFAPFKGRIPADKRIIFYTDAADSNDEAQRFGHVRIILAPARLILQPNSTERLAITDFTSDSAMRDFAAKKGFVVVREFGEGRAILKK